MNHLKQNLAIISINFIKPILSKRFLFIKIALFLIAIILPQYKALTQTQDRNPDSMGQLIKSLSYTLQNAYDSYERRDACYRLGQIRHIDAACALIHGLNCSHSDQPDLNLEIQLATIGALENLIPYSKVAVGALFDRMQNNIVGSCYGVNIISDEIPARCEALIIKLGRYNINLLLANLQDKFFAKNASKILKQINEVNKYLGWNYKKGLDAFPLIHSEKWIDVRNIGTPAIIPLLMLSNNDSAKIINVLQKIMDLHPQKSITELVSALYIQDDSVRKKAAAILEKINWNPTSKKEKVYYYLAKGDSQAIIKMGKDAVPYLLEALDFNHVEYCYCVADHGAQISFINEIGRTIILILGKIGDKQATRPLLRYLRNNDAFQTEIITTLGLLADTLAIPSLIDELKNSDAFNYTVNAITKIGKKATPLLIEALEKKDNALIQKGSIIIISNLEDTTALPNLNKKVSGGGNIEVIQEAIKAVVKIGNSSSIPHLVLASRYKSDILRLEAITALQKMNANVPDTYLSALNDTNYKVRIHAVLGLSEKNNTQAIKALAEALRTEMKESWINQEFVMNLIYSLGKFDSAEGVSAIIEAINNYQVNNEIKTKAIKVLTQIGKSSITPLIEGLQDNKVETRNVLVGILGELKNIAATKTLHKLLLEDKNLSVRREIAISIGKIGDTSSTEILLKVLTTEDSQLKINSIIALGEIRDRRATEMLIKFLELTPESYSVNKQTVIALGKIGDENAIHPLIKMFETLGKIKKELQKKVEKSKWFKWQGVQLRELQLAIINALGNTGGEKAIEILIKILKDDKMDDSYRIASQEALVKVGKPAVKPLNKLLKNKSPRVKELSTNALNKIGKSAL